MIDHKYVMARHKNLRADLAEWFPAVWDPEPHECLGEPRPNGTLCIYGSDGDDDRSISAAPYEIREITEEEFERAREAEGHSE